MSYKTTHDHGCFISTRSGVRESELVIIKADGNDRTLSYAHKLYTEIVAGIGIIFHLSYGRMTIEGRNLRELHLMLGKREIECIKEQYCHERDVPQDKPYISKIYFEFSS